jgi:gluconokinase
MHSFLFLSSCCAPLSPVFTWLDTTAPEGLGAVRRRLGDRLHQRTRCHYHPNLPGLKLAAAPPGRGNRVASPKSWLAWELTGSFVDDFGMASASGLLDVRSGNWAADILDIAGVESPDLPRLADPHEIVGKISEVSALRFGMPAGAPFVNGSGDGFLANAGSGCGPAERMAVTLGTSGAARRMTPSPSLNAAAGTFCYRASSNSFLLGCATSNGGNVLDWARNEFGPMERSVSADNDIPIFLPWMNGERSLEWNPDLRSGWHGRGPQHSPAQLLRAATEGVLFNMAQYVQVIERESGAAADQIVLSGNGFREPLLAPLLATLLGRELLYPQQPGLATLRGAAICAWRALGHDAGPAMERMLEHADHIEPMRDAALLERFSRFKQIRAHS